MIELGGLDSMGDGRGIQEGGDICTPVADWCWCMADANTILQLSSNKIKRGKIKESRFIDTEN